MSKIYFKTDLINCTCNYKDGDYIVFDKNIIFSANDNCVFNRTYDLEIGYFDTNLYMSDDKKSLYYPSMKINSSDDVYVYDKISAICDTPTYKIIINGSFKNCTCNYVNNDVLKKDKNIIITANNGYYFDKSFEIEIGGFTIPINRSTDNTKLIYDFTEHEIKDDVILNDNYYSVKKVVKLSPFIDIFNPSTLDLMKLSKNRFTDVEPYIDYFNYVTNLYLMPFKIPDKYKTTKKVILGFKDTQITTTLINDYQIKIDIGIIKVPDLYNNSFDYLNTICTLYLPYYDNIDIDVNYVIGKSLHIDYIYNLYIGSVTINIYSDNLLIHSINTDIKISYPYVINDKIRDNYIDVLNNDIKQAYMIVARNKPINHNNNNDVYITDMIDNYNGFITCKDIHINNFNGLQVELDMIKDKLREGIYNV